MYLPQITTLKNFNFWVGSNTGTLTMKICTEISTNATRETQTPHRKCSVMYMLLIQMLSSFWMTMTSWRMNTAIKQQWVILQYVNTLRANDENSRICKLPPHLDPHCLPSSLWILSMIYPEQNIFWNFADVNFVVCCLALKGLKRTPPCFHRRFCKTNVPGLRSPLEK